MNISKKVESFNSLPSGLVSVPLVFDDYGVESKGAIVSGVAGIKIDDSKDVPIVASVHGWAIFDENAMENAPPPPPYLIPTPNDPR